MRSFFIFCMFVLQISTLTIPNATSLQVYLLKMQIQTAFENAKKLGALHPLNITQTLISTDDELKMVFYFMPGLLEKLKQGQNRIIGLKNTDDPFINIEKGLFVRRFGQTHILMFNKYNIYDKHMVIVTTKYEPQISLISKEDLMYAGLTALSLHGILYYNGGKISGASQNHKHLQVLPEQGRNLPIISEILTYIQSQKTNPSQIFEYPHFHFIHGIIAIESSPSSFGQNLFSAYITLYSRIIQQNPRLNGTDVGYNIIGCDSFLMLIPRKGQKAFGVSVNALGYMGSVLFQKGEEMDSYFERHQPTQILEQISFK